MRVFELNVVGDTDSDGDGAPDVTIKAALFGNPLPPFTANVDLFSSLKFFNLVYGQVKALMGGQGK